jgi:hypothetical protein
MQLVSAIDQKCLLPGQIKAFERTLNRAVAQGELKSDTDTKALSQYLSHSAQGLRVLSKINLGSRKIDNIVNMSISTMTLY